MQVVVLWLHVLCGVAWVGACASFVLAAAALESEPKESRMLALRAAPRINRLCVPLAVIIPLTGIGNIAFAARARGFTLPAEFIGILAAKVALLAAMTFALWRSWYAAATLSKEPANGSGGSPGVKVHELTTLYTLIIGAGAIALALGFWLSGI